MKTEPNDPINPLTEPALMYCGLTKREYFAAMAMQAYQIRNGQRGHVAEHPEVIARRSVEQADILIDALNGITPPVKP